MQCEVKGDRPFEILWKRNNITLDVETDKRYRITEEILATGVESLLSIKRANRIDSAIFTCIATNGFGSDDSSINVIIQDVPEIPQALKVLHKSDRSVHLCWTKPFDGNLPIDRYIIEFKALRGSLLDDNKVIIVPGHTNEAEVQHLIPAMTYKFRISAENEIGLSDSSYEISVVTDEETPSSKP